MSGSVKNDLVTTTEGQNTPPAAPRLTRIDKKLIAASIAKVVKRAEKVGWKTIDETEKVDGPGEPIQKPTGRKIVVIQILLPR